MNIYTYIGLHKHNVSGFDVLPIQNASDTPISIESNNSPTLTNFIQIVASSTLPTLSTQTGKKIINQHRQPRLVRCSLQTHFLQRAKGACESDIRVIGMFINFEA